MEMREGFAQILTNLKLQNFKPQIELVLSEIEKTHKVKVEKSLLRKCGKDEITIEMEKQTFEWSHHPKCGSILVVNPNPIKLLEGDNNNWIWGLIHELGHQRDPTPPTKPNREKREVKAWENAAIIFQDLKFDNDLKGGFRKRAIYALDKYSEKYKWKRKYSWDQDGYKLISSSYE